MAVSTSRDWGLVATRLGWLVVLGAVTMWFAVRTLRAYQRSVQSVRKQCGRGNHPRPRLATSFARNLAIRSINFTGTGSKSGKRIVPLLTS